MIPSVWQLALLALAVYRLWRLASLDTWPPLVRARDWLVGPWYLGSGDVGGFRRPLLAEWLQCPWCSGSYAAGLVAAAWFVDARWTLLAATPLALATLVGALGHLLNE